MAAFMSQAMALNATLTLKGVATLHLFFYALSLLAPWTSALASYTLLNLTQLAFCVASGTLTEVFPPLLARDAADLHQRVYALSMVTDLAILRGALVEPRAQVQLSHPVSGCPRMSKRCLGMDYFQCVFAQPFLCFCEQDLKCRYHCSRPCFFIPLAIWPFALGPQRPPKHDRRLRQGRHPLRRVFSCNITDFDAHG